MWPQAVRTEREGGYVAELPSESTMTLVGAGA
jgi:hypothetical protein